MDPGSGLIGILKGTAGDAGHGQLRLKIDKEQQPGRRQDRLSGERRLSNLHDENARLRDVLEDAKRRVKELFSHCNSYWNNSGQETFSDPCARHRGVLIGPYLRLSSGDRPETMPIFSMPVIMVGADLACWTISF